MKSLHVGVLRIISLVTTLAGTAPGLSAASWEPLANGKDLTGWKQINGTAPYTVVDGAIVGITTVGSPNSFLATEATYEDFILELEMMQDVGPSNSGIQFRSESRPDVMNGRVFGYQCEVDPSARAWTGGIYDEARRGWLYPVDLNPAAKSLYQFGQWNQIRIEAIGSSIRTWINGKPVAHVVDNQTPRGFIALQVHSIGNEADAGRRVLWRNLRIQTRDLTPAPAATIPIRNLIVNTVSAAEQAAGWRLLWDGQTTKGWRGARQERFPEAGWKIDDGVLKVLESGGGESRHGGDIVTEEEFSAFELQLEFKLTPGANSGIKYFVREEVTPLGGSAIGLEFQLLDDKGHPDALAGVDGNRTLASLYDLIPRGPMPGGLAVVPRIGEWQHARVLVQPDGKVEHWLNGIKVVAYERGSADYLARVARSKYRDLPNFGLAPQGRILLQDHGNEVHFRSIKVRTLP